MSIIILFALVPALTYIFGIIEDRNAQRNYKAALTEIQREGDLAFMRMIQTINTKEA